MNCESNHTFLAKKESAPQLERSSFNDEERGGKKREWKMGIGAQIKIKLALPKHSSFVIRDENATNNESGCGDKCRGNFLI